MILLRIFSGFFILATFLPLIKWDNWWIRVFDYPRIQKFLINLLLLIGWISFSSQFKVEFWIWMSLLIVCEAFLIRKVIPFTPLGKKMIQKVNFDQGSGIHLIVANVYQYNRKYHKMLRLVAKENPDLVFMVETDQAWADAMKELEFKYSECIKIPLDNTYGLLLYTNLKIDRKETHYLIDSEIPSLELDIILNDGQKITLYAIHPTPPVPGENSVSTERDAEILIVGKKSKANPLPSLVIGDLNDVAWSYTTELFLKISEMADPRRGRGTFNTFHAKIPVFRWPLDHIFLSKEFGLSELKVLSGIGSDHFPISLKAVLTKRNTTDTLQANGDEKKEARQKISNGLD
ncbi:endonuclease/exonuclease/phosphatase family protein [Algoriphagus algorifonticola]|uniref:endonuclease/exonuclease/phosphatase family protein n=1 Tax=Algoriphagus algorifonticola TaxID=2593007 RepID=UPI0011A60778|nr:endonuclease/exonuclease/phosphatase family protein [Algoriphagus algorifonticola]